MDARGLVGRCISGCVVAGGVLAVTLTVEGGKFRASRARLPRAHWLSSGLR